MNRYQIFNEGRKTKWKDQVNHAKHGIRAGIKNLRLFTVLCSKAGYEVAYNNLRGQVNNEASYAH